MNIIDICIIYLFILMTCFCIYSQTKKIFKHLQHFSHYHFFILYSLENVKKYDRNSYLNCVRTISSLLCLITLIERYVMNLAE